MLADSNFSKISKNVLIGNSSAVLLTPGIPANGFAEDCLCLELWSFSFLPHPSPEGKALNCEDSKILL